MKGSKSRLCFLHYCTRCKVKGPVMIFVWGFLEIQGDAVVIINCGWYTAFMCACNGYLVLN